MRESLTRHPRRRRGQGLRLGTAVATPILLALAGLGAYVYLSGAGSDRAPPQAEAGADAPPLEAEPGAPATAPPEPARPEPAPPVRRAPAVAPKPALPPLDESDAEITSALSEAVGAERVETWLKPEQVVRNLVVTIDNLPRTALALEQRPFRPAPGELATAGTEETPVLDEANYERYRPFVELVASLDAEAVVELYDRHRPLFVEAYRELGYPEGDFDARLVEVIDHMLAAPTVEGPIRLRRPSVMYEFADESLEERSAGHKLMIRLGPENAEIVKRALRALRAVLTGGVAGTSRAEPAGQPRQ